MEDNNATSKEDLLFSDTVAHQVGDLANSAPPEVYVEPCQPDFFYKKYKQSYAMYKNPRGLCLIVNIYQIEGMPPRRWSDRDTEALKQLFEQLLFTVQIYTDFTHDLTQENVKRIIKEFSQSDDHQEAQCCIVCLMSHGEEGFLTTKEGKKLPLDDIFAMFNNVNCPYLVGKPKLFFIQSCRDDPVTGPAEDFGIRLSFKAAAATTAAGAATKSESKEADEMDGGGDVADNNCNNNKKEADDDEIINVNNDDDANEKDDKVSYHMPSLCDMLIGFPTQKGYIAYRKPEIGSWYMNAIVQVFSKHSKDTDLCAMLNMVNALISNEVTNTGKKQMSEFTSKFTKPVFYFFPGLASETVTYNSSKLSSSSDKYLLKSKSSSSSSPFSSADNRYLCESNNKYHISISSSVGDQSDSSTMSTMPIEEPFSFSTSCNPNLDQNDFELIASRATGNWKQLARAFEFEEAKIKEIDCCSTARSSKEKLLKVLNDWHDEAKTTESENNKQIANRLLEVLRSCNLNKLRDELFRNIQKKSQEKNLNITN